MNTLWASMRKDFLILINDIPGLLIIFLLPVTMVIVVTLVQNSTFEKIKGEQKTQILFADEDNDIVGKTIKEGLLASNSFILTEKYENKNLTAETAKQIITEGDIKIALIIPKGITERLREKIQPKIAQIFAPGYDSISSQSPKAEHISIFTDPSLQVSYRHYLRSSLNVYGLQIENKILFHLLQEEIEKMTGNPLPPMNTAPVLIFEEKPVYAQETDIIPNSTQHNVPAWTMFAMFFIVIPLAGSMIKERQDGSFTRIICMPGAYKVYLSAKALIYLGITTIQFLLMLLAGIFILPAMGLPTLATGSNPMALVLMVLSSGLAATGYGITIGTLSSTLEQAGVFGSVSVIILAALGGIWYPVYAMPDNIKIFSNLSPLNWGLNGFYKIFIKDLPMQNILPEAALLTGFFIILMIIAIISEKIRRLEL